MRYFFFILALVGLDHLVKSAVIANVPLMGFYPFYPYGGIGVLKNFLGGVDFSINYVQNTGAAWGLLADYSSALFVLRVLLCIMLIVFVCKKDAKLSLSLILAGAIGNILDFAIHGHVIDMFYFCFWGYSFAIFNVADSLICIGILVHMFVPWNKPAWLKR